VAVSPPPRAQRFCQNKVKFSPTASWNAELLWFRTRPST
jgi:hypothetical protein